VTAIGARPVVHGWTKWRCRKCAAAVDVNLPMPAMDCNDCFAMRGKRIAMVPLKLGRNKYNATRSSLFPGGRSYDSTAERDYRAYLNLLVQAGEVVAIREQPVIDLVAGISYRPDFHVIERVPPQLGDADGAETPVFVTREAWIDVKGVETETFRLKAKLWSVFGPGPLRIVKRGSKRAPWTVVREVVPQRRA
jgi:hypothetical protein